MATRTMFTGAGTALVTPFTTSGAVDGPAVKRLARRQIDAGIHFLVPCGTTGETPTLSAAERRRVVELVLEEASGQVPVMAGAGDNDTQAAVQLSKDMHSIGVQGLLQVTPWYNKPTPEGLFAHFSAVQRAWAHRLQHRRGDARAARDYSACHRRERSVGQHHADDRDLPRGAG